MRREPARERNLLDHMALVVKLLLLLAVVVVLVLGLSDAPIVANRLAGIAPKRPLVGLIAGHWQSDSGAVCPDGTEEVDLNLAIARQVMVMLRQNDYQVELLPEYAPKLNGYEAAVLLSIHCDSCVDLTGFKVARMTHSAVPEREDRLVNHLYASYAEATGLEPHLNTITDDMREYHALRRISTATPGAIIECGFMGGDRYLLTQESERVAVGIANGLLAFLREQEALAETPAAP